MKCEICGGEIKSGTEVEIPGIGVMHMEGGPGSPNPECMTDGERKFHEDCDRLDIIRNEFSRQGYLAADSCVWLIDKLQYEWELAPWWTHKK
jgi:hypothetical protein